MPNDQSRHQGRDMTDHTTAAQAASESAFPEQTKFDRLYNKTFKGYGLDAERLAHAELFWKEGHKLGLLSKLRAPVADERAEWQAFRDWAWKKEGPAVGQMEGQAAVWAGWQERARRAALASAPVAVTRTYVEARECAGCGHVGINDSSSILAACNMCCWSGDSPAKDHCPGCEQDGTMTSACPKCGEKYALLADRMLDVASAPVAGEAVYTLRVRGAIQAWTPTTAAFSIPDGEHQLFLSPAAPQASEAVPGCLLAADHVGMTVDYTGLLGQARSALKRGENAPAMAEMLRQLAVHLTELGQRWYAGDAAVVDEFLQLYCVESDTRAALSAQPGAQKKGGSDAK